MYGLRNLVLKFLLIHLDYYHKFIIYILSYDLFFWSQGQSLFLELYAISYSRGTLSRTNFPALTSISSPTSVLTNFRQNKPYFSVFILLNLKPVECIAKILFLQSNYSFKSLYLISCHQFTAANLRNHTISLVCYRTETEIFKKFVTMACPEGKEPTTSTDVAKNTDDEEENGVTLVEVLEEEAQLEEDANAVLGGSDDANCTYNLVVVLLNLPK